MTARTDFPDLAEYADAEPSTPLSAAAAGVLDYIDKLRADLVWQYVSTQASTPEQIRHAWQDVATRAGVAEADADRLWATVVALRGQAVADASPVGKAHRAALTVRQMGAV